MLKESSESSTSPLRPWQPLMRAVDVKGLDLELMFRRINENKIDSLIVNAAGFMSWYPTNLQFQKPNPFMDYDFLGSIIEMAKKNNIKIIARVDISKGYEDWYEEHPDWYVVKQDGTPDKYWDMHKTCFTGDYVQTINFNILDELLSRYEVDGLFYNFYYFEKCFCQRCQNQVNQATGHPIPLGDQMFYPYERFRHRQVATHIRDIRHKLKEYYPNAKLLIYHHMHKSWDPRLVSDEVDIWTSQISSPFIPNPLDPQPVWPYWPSEESLKGLALKADQPPWLMLTYSQIFSSRRVNQPGERLIYQMAQTIAHGAKACPSLNGISENLDDPRAIIEVENEIKKYAHYSDLFNNTDSIDDIALVYSPDSLWFGSDRNNMNGSQYGHVKEFRGVFGSLKTSHHQFSVIYSDRFDQKTIEKKKIIILPAVQCLSSKDQLILEKWVKDGGWVIVTANTGVYDENGNPRIETKPSLMRMNVENEIDSTGGYLLVHSESLQIKNEGSSLIGLVGPFYKNQHHNSDMFLSLLGPFLNNAPEYSYWEKNIETGASGLDINKIGNGGIVTIPWHIGSLFHQFGIPDYSNLLDWIINNFLGEPIFTTDAPHSVEINVRIKRKDNKIFWLIHLINGSSGADRPFIKFIPITPITISLKQNLKKAYQAFEKRELTIQKNNGSSSITTGVIKGHEILILEFE